MLLGLGRKMKQWWEFHNNFFLCLLQDKSDILNVPYIRDRTWIRSTFHLEIFLHSVIKGIAKTELANYFFSAIEVTDWEDSLLK